MSPIGIGALIVSAIALVIVTALVPRLWRGQITTVTVRQYWWPGGDDSWIRFVRAWPVLFVAGWLMIVLGVIFAAQGATRSATSEAVENVLLVLFAVAFLTATTIFLFAWPRRLIPPWLRPTDGKR